MERAKASMECFSWEFGSESSECECQDACVCVCACVWDTILFLFNIDIEINTNINNLYPCLLSWSVFLARAAAAAGLNVMKDEGCCSAVIPTLHGEGPEKGPKLINESEHIYRKEIEF